MGLNLEGVDAWLAEAVSHFWCARRDASEKQKAGGRLDAGQRSAVTAGKNMDGFIEFVRKLVVANGLPEKSLITSKGQTLPGFFRPTKNWDVLIIHRSRLVAVLEFKSQVGSLGNNFNNRCEECLGNATDFWTAHREGAFVGAPPPFLGYVMLLEDSPQARKVARFHSPHFAAFPEFVDTSYARRYDLLCRKLVTEKLYSSAALVLSAQTGRGYCTHTSLSDATGFRAFAASLAGAVAVAAVE